MDVREKLVELLTEFYGSDPCIMALTLQLLHSA